MSNSKKWIVTATDKNALADVTNKLTENGFVVDEVLEEVCCITGSANEDTVSRLRNIPGVADVSPDQEIDIGPPGSTTTW